MEGLVGYLGHVNGHLADLGAVLREGRRREQQNIVIYSVSSTSDAWRAGVVASRWTKHCILQCCVALNDALRTRRPQDRQDDRSNAQDTRKDFPR